MNSKIKVKYPIGIQWKIAKTKLKEKRNSIEGFLNSIVFNIPGTDVKYFLKIFPNGDKDETRGKTQIYFYLKFEEKKEIDAEFSYSIETANYFDEKKFVYKESIGWGGKAICTVDELFDPAKHFIVGDEMIIEIEGFLLIEKNAESYKLGENGNTLGITLWNQESKDFAIVADGKEILVHKIILSARSPVFAAMFQPHTMEAQNNRVVIPDFSFGIVETAIKSCYDPRLVENISLDVMLSLLQFFDKYDIQSLKMDLEKRMILEVNELTVCRLANCSILSNTPKLRKKCAEFLEECFRQRKPVSDFDALDKDFCMKW